MVKWRSGVVSGRWGRPACTSPWKEVRRLQANQLLGLFKYFDEWGIQNVGIIVYRDAILRDKITAIWEEVVVKYDLVKREVVIPLF